MNCDRPIIMYGNAFGCGQCVPCRSKKRREWVHRMMLEAAQYKDNAFVTVTYDEQSLPQGLNVDPRTLSLFIKRLRKTGLKFRYFGCGEYGDYSLRPHYHIALFGFPSCSWGITRKRDFCCDTCERVKRAWGFGQVMLGTLEPKSMAYVAGYVTKKMKSKFDKRLEGRLPEFVRMSLRPGLGYGMMHDVADALLEHDLHKILPDVPYGLEHGSRVKYPLGRYLRGHLRKMVGKEKNASEEALREMDERMRSMRESAFDSSEPLRVHVLKASEGRRIQIHARYNAQKKKVGI